jgi:hypothetical protein
MYALCIIDLQECFSGATFSKLINSVTREIDLAKKLSCPILVLELESLRGMVSNRAFSKSLESLPTCDLTT